MKKLLVAALVAASVTSSAFGFTWDTNKSVMGGNINKTTEVNLNKVLRALEKTASTLEGLRDAHKQKGNKKTAKQTKVALKATKNAQDAAQETLTVFTKETGANLE